MIATAGLTFSELYFQDLGALFVQIRSVQWTVEICAGVLPAKQVINQVALQSWQHRYRPFLDEISARLVNSSQQLAKVDPQGVKFVNQFEEKLNLDLNKKRDFLTRQLNSDSYECEYFSQELATDKWNLEHRFPDEVTTIRRVPN